jgi:toxin YhaV
VKLGRYNDWLLLAHPQFEDQYSTWLTEVQRLSKKDPQGYRSKMQTKRFAALHKLVFQVIPADPASAKYLLGNSLGEQNRNWRRAKFGQQFRLFFRFDSKAKIIIYAWVNNQDALRAYGSKTDAHLVFAQKLSNSEAANKLGRTARRSSARLVFVDQT